MVTLRVDITSLEQQTCVFHSNPSTRNYMKQPAIILQQTSHRKSLESSCWQISNLEFADRPSPANIVEYQFLSSGVTTDKPS